MTRKKFDSIRAIFTHFENTPIGELTYTWLYHVVDYFRPKNPQAKISILELTGYLQQHSEQAQRFASYLVRLTSGKPFGNIISDVGISEDASFFYELTERIVAKILPPQPPKGSVQYLLNQVFYKETDYAWLSHIPMSEWKLLHSILKTDTFFTEASAQNGVLSEINAALGRLMQRMGGRAFEAHIVRMAPEYSYLTSPFLGLEQEFFVLRKKLEEGDMSVLSPQSVYYKQVLILLSQCNEFVEVAFKNSAKYGINMRVNQGLLRISEQLTRVEAVLQLLSTSCTSDSQEKTIQIMLTLIGYNCKKNDISTYLKESTQSVAYEITQFTASTGEHYITSSTKEYWQMLRASLGGGLVVGFMCIAKELLHHTPSSEFGYAVMYSLNYAVGFIMIYLLGFTLATKQPAMTATTLIRAIEVGLRRKDDEEKHADFAVLFSRLCRSQFIAFVGNVVMAFPVALFLVWVMHHFFGFNLMEHGGQQLLEKASPYHSPALIHAGIAGVFLFLSGIITGSVANSNLHNQVEYRIAEHPILKRLFSEKTLLRIAHWIAQKSPGLFSNFWFGVFMGSTASVGVFLGLNLDIRHITFVSGNIAMGLYGNGFEVDIPLLLWAVVGLVGVGAMNFLVSFSLAIYLAFRSRSISAAEVFPLLRSIGAYFKKHPLSFFFPPKGNSFYKSH